MGASGVFVGDLVRVGMTIFQGVSVGDGAIVKVGDGVSSASSAGDTDAGVHAVKKRKGIRKIMLTLFMDLSLHLRIIGITNCIILIGIRKISPKLKQVPVKCEAGLLYNRTMDFISTLSALPSLSAKRIALRITPPAERALRKGHPWIFDQSIKDISHAGAPGDLAVIFDKERRFEAIGLYDPTSSIRVRILQVRQPAAINVDWFQSKIKMAARARASFIKHNTDGYRLINGENDGLPGLIIDRYADTLVLKLYTPAWIPHLKDFCDALAKVSPAAHVILRLSRSLENQTLDVCRAA